MKKTLSLPVLSLFLFLSCETSTYQEYMSVPNDRRSSDRISPQEAVEQVRDFLSAWYDETRSDVPQKEIGEVYAWRNCDICSSSQGTRSTVSNMLPDTLLYIVNFESEGGYALVSAEASSPDVIAFVENGSLRPEQKIENPGFQLFLDGYVNYTKPPVPVRDTIIARPFTIDSVPPVPNSCSFWGYEMRVLPLLSTQWSQKFPYNLYCVTNNGKFAPAGCAPVALGQIAAYHRYPSSYAGHAYNWDAIMSYKSVPESDMAACISVANLIHDIGMIIGVHYTPDTGGVYDANIHCLWKPFGYHYVENTTCPFDSLKASLKRHEPVLVYGTGTYNGNRTGHCWVIDGIAVMNKYNMKTMVATNGESSYYQNAKIESYNLVHCNWGWGGLDDGYFLYEALEKKFDVSSHTISDIEVVIDNVRGVQWQIHPLFNN